MRKPGPAARKKARRFVLQALYQMSLSGCSSSEVETQFFQDHDMKRVDTLFLHELLTGINANRSDLQQTLSGELDREFDELDPVETAALFVGAYELLHRPDIPYRVAINESVELAKQFGAAESHKLVNSVLDKLAKVHRPHEINRR